MSRFTQVIIILLIVVLSLLPLSAQDDTTRYEFEDSGVSFTYPDTWEVEEVEGSVIFMDDLSTIIVFDPSIIMTAYELTEDSTKEDVILNIPEIMAMDFEVDPDMIYEMDIEEPVTAAYDFELADDAGMATAIAIELPDETLVLIISMLGETAGQEVDEQILNLLASFDSAAGVPCTVSNGSAGDAAMRVGPGFNRGVFGSMPAGDYAVVGWSTANDDSLWWKLDKTAVAPKAAAAEVWVLQDDVVSSGDCDAVPDAFAPPVIPNMQAPPPPPPVNNNNAATDNSTDSSDTSTDNSAPATGGTSITEGNWTLTWGTAVITCGNRQGSINLGLTNGPVYVDVISETSLVIDGVRVNKQGDTYYGTWYQFVDGANRPFNLAAQVSSSTYMNGSMGATVEGCTIIQPFTLSK